MISRNENRRVSKEQYCLTSDCYWLKDSDKCMLDIWGLLVKIGLYVIYSYYWTTGDYYAWCGMKVIVKWVRAGKTTSMEGITCFNQGELNGITTALHWKPHPESLLIVTLHWNDSWEIRRGCRDGS